MVIAQLFFGRSIPGREPLSDAEWADFVFRVIGRLFPDGFTVSDGEGQWLNPRSGAVVRERTKILVVATEMTFDLGNKISTVIDAYRKRFRQQSVGLITAPGCASFS